MLYLDGEGNELDNYLGKAELLLQHQSSLDSVPKYLVAGEVCLRGLGVYTSERGNNWYQDQKNTIDLVTGSAKFMEEDGEFIFSPIVELVEETIDGEGMGSYLVNGVEYDLSAQKKIIDYLSGFGATTYKVDKTWGQGYFHLVPNKELPDCWLWRFASFTLQYEKKKSGTWFVELEGLGFLVTTDRVLDYAPCPRYA